MSSIDYEVRRQCFNPRTRVGCDIWAFVYNKRYTLFQSTHPRGVRLASTVMQRMPWPGFNPRTRVGCDRVLWAVSCQLFTVSIHAPAWGATSGSRTVRNVPLRCFNPRTRVGCDNACVHTCAGMYGFQSTHPRGVRHIAEQMDNVRMQVSIHAPAWGATRESATKDLRTGWFQSTHPRGVRHAGGGIGRDRFLVSIHAPAWGATSSCR